MEDHPEKEIAKQFNGSGTSRKGAAQSADAVRLHCSDLLVLVWVISVQKANNENIYLIVAGTRVR